MKIVFVFLEICLYSAASMIKNTHSFSCAYDLIHNLEKFTSELDDLLGEAKGHELKELNDHMIHLAAFREAMIAIEDKVLARKELERVEELAERDVYKLEDVDGQKLTFEAPAGFEIVKGCPIYTYDLYQLEVVGGKIVKARDAFRRMDLTSVELDKCNSELKLVQG